MEGQFHCWAMPCLDHMDPTTNWTFSTPETYGQAWETPTGEIVFISFFAVASATAVLPGAVAVVAVAFVNAAVVAGLCCCCCRYSYSCCCYCCCFYFLLLATAVAVAVAGVVVAVASVIAPAAAAVSMLLCLLLIPTKLCVVHREANSSPLFYGSSAIRKLKR